MNLFNTFRSYIDMESYFPVKLVQHTDVRGSFVETVKIGVGGQVSFLPPFLVLQGEIIITLARWSGL